MRRVFGGGGLRLVLTGIHGVGGQECTMFQAMVQQGAQMSMYWCNKRNNAVLVQVVLRSLSIGLSEVDFQSLDTARQQTAN